MSLFLFFTRSITASMCTVSCNWHWKKCFVWRAELVDAIPLSDRNHKNLQHFTILLFFTAHYKECWFNVHGHCIHKRWRKNATDEYETSRHQQQQEKSTDKIVEKQLQFVWPVRLKVFMSFSIFNPWRSCEPLLWQLKLITFNSVDLLVRITRWYRYCFLQVI